MGLLKKIVRGNVRTRFFAALIICLCLGFTALGAGIFQAFEPLPVVEHAKDMNQILYRGDPYFRLKADTVLFTGHYTGTGENDPVVRTVGCVAVFENAYLPIVLEETGERRLSDIQEMPINCGSVDLICRYSTSADYREFPEHLRKELADRLQISSDVADTYIYGFTLEDGSREYRQQQIIALVVSGLLTVGVLVLLYYLIYMLGFIQPKEVKRLKVYGEPVKVREELEAELTVEITVCQKEMIATSHWFVGRHPLFIRKLEEMETAVVKTDRRGCYVEVAFEDHAIYRIRTSKIENAEMLVQSLTDLSKGRAELPNVQKPVEDGRTDLSQGHHCEDYPKVQKDQTSQENLADQDSQADRKKKKRKIFKKIPKQQKIRETGDTQENPAVWEKQKDRAYTGSVEHLSLIERLELLKKAGFGPDDEKESAVKKQLAQAALREGRLPDLMEILQAEALVTAELEFEAKLYRVNMDRSLFLVPKGGTLLEKLRNYNAATEAGAPRYYYLEVSSGYLIASRIPEEIEALCSSADISFMLP